MSWGNGATGTFGTISATNSLVGTTDKIADSIFYQLKGSSNYVLANRTASVGGDTNFGSVTWANGDAPIIGTVSAANSLMGSASGDQVGAFISTIDNGNYLIGSPFWNNGRGALTLGNGSKSIFGTINEQNSLVGSTTGDNLGNPGNGIIFNDNKAPILLSYYDDPNRNLANAGAVTIFDGNTGTTGIINSTNSYIGNTEVSNPAVLKATYDTYNKRYYAYFPEETVNGFSRNGAISPSNAAPNFTSANSTSFTVGNNDSFQIVAKGIPEDITYTLNGTLPSGITLSPQGLLSGTAAAGTGRIHTFDVVATNAFGSFTQSFTLTMKEAPLIISTGPIPAFVIGDNTPSTYTFAASGFPLPTFSIVDSLPNGVTLSSSGVLSGIPTAPGSD